MVYCIVSGCKNRSETREKKLRYYTFPKEDHIRNQWVSACGKQKSFKIDCARVCSEHFIQADFKLQDILLNVPVHKRRLQNGAVPSKNMPNPKRLSKKEKKRKKMENKALVEECLVSYEKKQIGMQMSSANKHHGLQENTKGSKGRLASYASIHLSNENQPSYPVTNRRKEKNYEVQEESVDPSDYNSNNMETPLEEHSYSHIKYFTNGTTQTEYDYECCKELHIMRLESQNRKLKATIRKQALRARQDEILRTSVSNIMTKGQVKRLLHPGKQLKWNAEDIASAMSLYSAGPNAYALLRRRNFPLPSSSTLRGRAGKIEIKPGLLNSVVQLMKKLDYNEKERLCVLCFNKIKLKASSYSEKSNNAALTRAKWAHVVMVRGLIKDWTQIIYYDLDVPVSSSVLKSIIVKLAEIHYIVTAVVSDMSPTIPALWEELCITETQPFFLHPSDTFRKIFFFADVLHLINLLRNLFINTGFILSGKTIDTGPIKDILNLDNCKLRISHEHLQLSKHGLRNVNLATELLSHSVSGEIRRHISLGEIHSHTALECADFIKVVSDWFQVFNSEYTPVNSKEIMNSYGLNVEVQNSILTLMSNKVRNLRAPKRQTLLRFQSGILVNNTALPQMLEYIKLKYNITYIITASLNHKELEKFFNIIRFKGGPNDHPTPLEFKYRLRSSLLGKMIV